MNDINSGVIVGRIVADSTLRYTGTGMALCNFCIASNRSVKKGDEWKDEASFIDLTIWGKKAEGLNKYLAKGQQVAVQYSLEQQRWEKDGQKQSKLALHVEDIQLLGGKREGGEAQEAPQSQPSYQEDPPF